MLRFFIGSRMTPDAGNKKAKMTISQDILDKYNLVAIADNHFINHMMYATTENMTSTAVYAAFGIEVNEGYLHRDAYQALLKLIPVLKKKNLRLKIYDAFRPARAHEKLRDIVPIENFFATKPERSNHCRGTAVDLCLCDEYGNDLEYPTQVDGYTPEFAAEVKNGVSENFIKHLQKARHDFYAPDYIQAATNRDYLREIMSDAGFDSIMHEWWHYDLRVSEPYPTIIY